jgi:3-isopropylmalate dehydratase small subunit
MGRAYVFGDNIDTDVILPGRYLSYSEKDILAAHCMEGYDPTLASRLEEGDIFVAGRNFGCGSSREGAPVAMRAAGVSCVIAKSFARIFYRNAINIGLPVLESPEAADGIVDGSEVAVDISSGRITDISAGKEYSFLPFPGDLLRIIEAGGLREYYKRKQSGSYRDRRACEK